MKGTLAACPKSATRRSPKACFNLACGMWFLWLCAAQAWGQMSVLDPSFKIGPGANGTVWALILQADQRFLVGGAFTTIGGCSNSYLARLEADGSVDATFDPAGETDGAVQCLVQQPDGKVVVGGGFQRLLGQPRQRLARLLADGSVDGSFDAGGLLATNCTLFSMALQNDGRLLLGYLAGDEHLSHIVRLETNGAPDSTFACTNSIGSYIFSLLPLADGSVLCAGNPLLIPDARWVLFRLKPNGERDESFDPRLEVSSAFCLLQQPNGQVLVGGWLIRKGASNGVPLLRLNQDLSWDESFHPGVFSSGGMSVPVVYALVLRPDGKLVVGGSFSQVEGYWRRNLVRLTAEGHVDGCFDPGLGFGDSSDGPPVWSMLLQPDGRVVVGGAFHGVDTAVNQFCLGRLLPQSGCDLIRTYLVSGDQWFAAATFPPGGTNYLEVSQDLRSWELIQSDVAPYLWHPLDSLTNPPQAFFRARQER